MSETNLWIKEEDNVRRVGLTAHAQDDLGSISFAMLPKIGKDIAIGDEVVELEAEKAVVEYESPVYGTVVEVNEAALLTPTLLDEPDAWLYAVEKK